METGIGSGAALDALRSIGTRWPTASDDELLGDGAEWEALGRIVDARRAAFAAEVDARSKKRLGENGLAFRHDQRDGANLVAKVARTSVREAQRRIAIGAALAPGRTLSGEEVPGKLPVLGSAVRIGAVGIDAAARIAGTLHAVRKRASAEDLAAAEEALTAVAAEADAEIVAMHAALWRDRLDQDGPEPNDHDRHRQRLLKLHRLDEYGGSRFSGYLPAEDRAEIAALLATRRRSAAMTRLEAGDEDADGLGPEWRISTASTAPRARWTTTP